MLYFPSCQEIGVTTLIIRGRPSPAGLWRSSPPSSASPGTPCAPVRRRADAIAAISARIQNRASRWTRRGRLREMTSSCARMSFSMMLLGRKSSCWEAKSVETTCQALVCRGPSGVARYQTQPAGLPAAPSRSFFSMPKKFSPEFLPFLLLFFSI